MGHDLDAVFYVAKAPTVEFRDGNFHVCYDIGKHATIEVVMPPSAFVKARLLGSEVIAKWRMFEAPDDDKVKPFRGK